jgi:hypothetical protein
MKMEGRIRNQKNKKLKLTIVHPSMQMKAVCHLQQSESSME